jgi:hypothetical protein
MTPLIFRIANRSHFSAVPCRTSASRSLALKSANGIITLAKESESESVRLREWRAILTDQMAVPKFSDREYRMSGMELRAGLRRPGTKKEPNVPRTRALNRKLVRDAAPCPAHRARFQRSNELGGS